MSGDRSNFLSQPVVKNVLVYRNGDPFFEGRRLVVNEKRVSSFESFLKEVTGGVQAPFGVVKTSTHQETDIVWARWTICRVENNIYLQIGAKKKKPTQNNTLQIKPVAHSRIAVSARFLRPIQEPCAIFVIVNGDILNPAVRLLIPRRILSQWDPILEMITEKMSLRILGAVRSLYTLDGNLVSDRKELENGQFYVAVGREKFKKLPYGDLIFTKPAPTRRYNGSKAASLPPIFRFRKHKESVGDRQSKSTGGSSDIGDPLASPQPLLPKRKGKKEQFSAANDAANHGKPVKVKRNKDEIVSNIPSDNEEDVFKAYEENAETRRAVEVQEDEGLQVVLPVDQTEAETVDEEEDVEETLKDEDLLEDNKWECQVDAGQEADESTEEDTVASWGDHEEDLINDNEEDINKAAEELPQETPEEPSQEMENLHQEMPELEQEESRKSCSPLKTPSSPESKILEE